MITTFQNLLNSGSKSMSVDGSSVNKVFSYTLSSDGILTGFTCILKDEGTTSLNKLGAITAPSNGILVQIIQSGNTRTIATIKDNADLCKYFHYNQFGNSAVLSILSIVTPEGFGNSNNVFVGFMELDHPIDLLNGDTIQVVVQDNLTNIDLLEVTCKVCID